MKRLAVFSRLRNLLHKADKALGKYIEPRRGEYNFLDVVSNIKLTEAQINEEIHKHHQRNRQIPMLLTLVSLLFAYLPKIISSQSVHTLRMALSSAFAVERRSTSVLSTTYTIASTNNYNFTSLPVL